MSRRIDESGQTTLEWLGIAVVVVAILLALLSAAPALGREVGSSVSCLVERIVSGAGLGSLSEGCGGDGIGGDGDGSSGDGEGGDGSADGGDGGDGSADGGDSGDGSADGGDGGDGSADGGDTGDGSSDGSGTDAEPQLTPLEEALQGDYIAIGDSFSSGEGAGDYDSDCHRSANGYPVIIGESYPFEGDVINVTCSGAVIGNVNGDNGQHGEDPQIQAITEDASLITIGISGNDTGWVDVVSSCATDGSIGGDICGDTDAVRDRMDSALEAYDELLREIMAGDHDARVIAIGYPRFFPEPAEEEWNYGCNPFGCLARISPEEQDWMNDLFREYNDRLREIAEANGVEFIDVHDAFDGCELTTSDSCMNGLIVDTVWDWPPVEANPGSFHPNAQGQEALAEHIMEQIENP